MKDHSIRRILGFFLLIFAVVVYVAVDSVRNIDRSMSGNDWVNHTHEVILAVNGALSDIRSGDAAVLLYVTTGDARAKLECKEVFADLDEQLGVARDDTRRESGQHEEILRLMALCRARVDFDQSILAARRSSDKETVQALLSGDAGIESTHEIQTLVEKVTSEEMALLADRDHASFDQAQTTRATVWAGVALDFLLFAGVAWLIWIDLTARRAAAAALQSANDQLEVRVRERTAELAATVKELRSENLERRWANQTLEHQLNYNILIINSISDAVFVLTKSMNISRINPAVVHLVGLEPHELVNRPFSCVVQLNPGAGGGNGLLHDPLYQALAEGRDLRDLPAVLEDKRGRKTSVRLTIFPLRDGDKVVGGIVVLQIASKRVEN
jgi:PAS domain-containing protein